MGVSLSLMAEDGMSGAAGKSPALASTSAVVIRSMTRRCKVGRPIIGCEAFR
jgi:hypothetical protein